MHELHVINNLWIYLSNSGAPHAFRGNVAALRQNPGSGGRGRRPPGRVGARGAVYLVGVAGRVNRTQLAALSSRVLNDSWIAAIWEYSSIGASDPKLPVGESGSSHSRQPSKLRNRPFDFQFRFLTLIGRCEAQPSLTSKWKHKQGQ